MKRLGFLAGVLLIALCLLAGAYGVRTVRAGARSETMTPHQEMRMVGDDIDRLERCVKLLKADMVSLKVELTEPAKPGRRAVRPR